LRRLQNSRNSQIFFESSSNLLAIIMNRKAERFRSDQNKQYRRFIMKKFAIGFVVIATLVVALMSTSYVFAQGNGPASPQAPGTGGGYGVNGAGISRGTGPGYAAGGAVMAGDGILHDAMVAVYAQELGISVDEINARLEAGETISAIAYGEGMTTEEFSAMMSAARSQALDQAVAAGTLTQEQADWMKSRGNMGYAGGNTAGSQAGRGAGRMARGAGGLNPDCPYQP
jgi:hypothetical protein